MVKHLGKPSGKMGIISKYDAPPDITPIEEVAATGWGDEFSEMKLPQERLAQNQQEFLDEYLPQWDENLAIQKKESESKWENPFAAKSEHAFPSSSSQIESTQSYQPPHDSIMGPPVYPPAQQNPQPFYRPDYQFGYPQGKSKIFNGGYGEYYNSQWTLPPAWTESGVMLVLPSDPCLWSEVISRWESITINRLNKQTWSDNKAKLAFVENLLGESEKLMWQQWRTAYPGAYSALEAIADEPQNITSQVRQLILLEDPYRGSTDEQDRAYRDLDRITCEDTKNLWSFLEDFRQLATKSGRLYFPSTTEKLFAKLPPSLSKKIEESFRAKHPGLSSGVLPAIKFHQVAMDEESIHWTAFLVPGGLYEWLVMPFGLKNAPPVFQRKMDKCFKGTESFIVSGVGRMGRKGIVKWKKSKEDPRSSERICAYASGKFSTTQSTIDAEINACINTLEKLKIYYLDKQEVTLRTDCQAIISFYNKTNSNKSSRVRWIKFADAVTGTGVKINIEHIEGKHNTLADSLSRLVNLCFAGCTGEMKELAAAALYSVEEVLQSPYTFQKNMKTTCEEVMKISNHFLESSQKLSSQLKNQEHYTNITSSRPTKPQSEWINLMHGDQSLKTLNLQQQKKQLKPCDTYKQPYNTKLKSALGNQPKITTGPIKEKMLEFKIKKPEESSLNWKPWHKDWDAITSNYSKDDVIKDDDNTINDDDKYRYNRKGFLEDDESSDDSIFIVDPGWDDYSLQAIKSNRPIPLCPEARRARM
ncbi:Orf y [Tanacetum coccineum]